MKKWEKVQRSCKRIEVIGIISMVIFIALGLFCDWNVLTNEIVLISVDDIESFSLTILQIQSTIGTLIFAIIALIAGNISESYMGVSISDFYLNIRPWRLTQKVLIMILLGLCLFGVIFYSLGLYNSVFYSFVVTLIAILISILDIYSALKG